MSLPNHKKPKTPATSHSSSSRLPMSSSSAMGTGAQRDLDADADDSSAEDDPPQTHFEKMMRNRERKANPDRKERMEGRRLIAEGWDEDENITSPEFYVRNKNHQFQQPGNFCEELGHAFICLRLAGYSIEETIKHLKSESIAKMTGRWNTTKNSPFGLPQLSKKEVADFNILPPIISTRGPRLTMIAHDILKRIPKTATVAQSIHHPYGHSMNADYVLFEKMIGCFPPAPNFNQHHQYYFSVPFGVKNCVVNASHEPLDLSARLTRGSETVEGVRRPYARPSLQKNLFAAYVPCSTHDVAPGAASIGGVNLRRTALPFVTLGTTNASDTEYHIMVVDFSDPAHPGIFDPNFGWIELRQGHCMLDLEKVLFDLWEHYTNTESVWNSAVAAKNFNTKYPFEEGFPAFGRKGTRYLNFKELGRASFIACQVHVQSSLAVIAPAFEHKSAFSQKPLPSPGASQHSASFSSIRPPLKRKFSGDGTDK